MPHNMHNRLFKHDIGIILVMERCNLFTWHLNLAPKWIAITTEYWYRYLQIVLKIQTYISTNTINSIICSPFTFSPLFMCHYIEKKCHLRKICDMRLKIQKNLLLYVVNLSLIISFFHILLVEMHFKFDIPFFHARTHTKFSACCT